MAVFDPTPSMIRAWTLIDAVLRRTQVKIRRAQISEIRVPSGVLARSSSGRLLVYPNLESLTTDALTDHDRRKSRLPDALELAEFRRVALVCEKFQPAMLNGRLQEIVLRDCVLRRSPTGEIMAITSTDATTVADIEVPVALEPEIEPPDSTDDVTLQEYRAEEQSVPFVAVREEPVPEWRPPAKPKPAAIRSSEFPTARHTMMKSVSRMRCPRCKSNFVHGLGNEGHIAYRTLRGGPIIDIAGKRQHALYFSQAELLSTPKSVIGISDAQERERQHTRPVEPAPAVIAVDPKLHEWDIAMGRLEGRHPEDRRTVTETSVSVYLESGGT